MRNDLPRADFTVFAKDYPEVRLVVEAKAGLPSPRDIDATVKRIARHMWGTNCHYGLILTPATTYVLRDDFTRHGPEAIHVSDIVPTEKLLSRLGRRLPENASHQELELLVREWLERLSTSYETALPDDPDVTKALFPEVVSAVTEGRVVAEAYSR